MRGAREESLIVCFDASGERKASTAPIPRTHGMPTPWDRPASSGSSVSCRVDAVIMPWPKLLHFRRSVAVRESKQIETLPFDVRQCGNGVDNDVENFCRTNDLRPARPTRHPAGAL